MSIAGTVSYHLKKGNQSSQEIGNLSILSGVKYSSASWNLGIVEASNGAGYGLYGTPSYYLIVEYDSPLNMQSVYKVSLPRTLVLNVDGKNIKFSKEGNSIIKHPTEDDGTESFRAIANYSCSIADLGNIAHAEKIRLTLPGNEEMIITSYLSEDEIKNIDDGFETLSLDKSVENVTPDNKSN